MIHLKAGAQVLAICPQQSLFRCNSESGLFLYAEMSTNKANPRYANGSLRRKYRARIKAQGGPCGICRGRLGPIHYDEPSDAAHPLSFVVDEIRPISRWREFGYTSPAAAAQDWDNLQAAHYICNQRKSNKLLFSMDCGPVSRKNAIDGDW